MKRIAIVALLVAGCAGVPRHYVRGDATAEDFASDKAACKAQAMSQGNAFMAPEVFDLCLQGKGWRQQ